MNLKQRVMRYMLGLGIGCAIVFFTFPNYDWLSWTPNKTLMKQIRESKFILSERGLCFLQCTGTSTEQLQAIRSVGKIDFGKSDTRSSPKKYHVVYGEMGLDVLVTDTLVMLDAIRTTNQRIPCTCQ